MTSFWDKLSRPFFALAPMEDVTDTVFRQIVASIGKPDVFFTEFTHVDAILHGDLQRLKFTDLERPIVAQVWGTVPEQFAAAAKLIKQMWFDGIDINLGCPERKIVKQGGCSALIGQNQLVSEIIAATKESSLPVSVKTRLGQKRIITEDWIGFLQTQDLAAITIHARTAAEKSLVSAHWDEFAKIPKTKTLLIGNGDIKNLTEAKKKAKEFGLDGIMVGRGIFENVSLFADKELSQEQNLALFRRHVQLFDQTWGKSKNFQILKKFAKTYIHGYAGASELREQIATTKNITELFGIISTSG